VRYPLLARLASLTTVAMGAALGLLVGGVLAVIGGSYARKVVHDQLAPQKISFAPAGSPQLPPDIKQYAGKPVLDGPTAKVFACGGVRHAFAHVRAVAPLIRWDGALRGGVSKGRYAVAGCSSSTRIRASARYSRPLTVASVCRVSFAISGTVRSPP
jgi:hypothetical protein